jgi:hypothetical protein
MFTGLFLLILPVIVFPANQFIYYAFSLPFGIGKSRMGGSFITRFAESLKYFKILAICMIPLLLYLFAKEKDLSDRRQVPRFVVVVVITIITGVLTKNSFYNFTSPVFIITFVIFFELLRQRPLPAVTKRLFSSLHLFLLLLLFAGVSILNFRREIDIRFSYKDLDTYSEALGFFVKTPLGRHSKTDLERLKMYISNNNVLYTGDSQFLFSLSGKKNPLPITHLNDGTTYNSSDSSHYTQLKEKLMQNMATYNSNLLITDITWNENKDFMKFINRFRGEKLDSFGLIKVYRVRVN